MRYARFAIGLLGGAALALGVLVTASAQPQAQAQGSDTVTLTMLANVNNQPAYDVLIPNFERVTARFGAHAKVDPGDFVEVTVTTERLHFFDLATGRAIR